jgi:muramidase (phage lysozyme)
MTNHATAERIYPPTNNNLPAFLYVIRKAEGTAAPNGYKYLFGSRYDKERLFKSFADHPRVYTSFKDKTGKQLRTSAAGAYQFIVPTWNALAKRLGLKDFSPANQDKAAIELIREKGALPDIEAGRFEVALKKVRKIWASLPNSGHNQPERSLSDAIKWYKEYGGTFDGSVPG